MAQSLFDNKLFQQYLAAAGSDIGSGQPIGNNVNALTMQSAQDALATEKQNKQSKNFLNLVQKMLSGEMPEGGSVKVSDKGMALSIPSTAYTSSGQTPPSGQPTQTQQPINNPFTNISDTDISGMTPEMILKAIELPTNTAYKRALTEQALAAAEKSRNPPVKDTRTTDIKNYEYAKDQGFTGTLEDWNTTDTADWKDYQKAKAEGYAGNFYKWQKEMAALSGGLTLDEFAARKEVTGDIESRQYFTDPKGLAKDVDNYANSKEARRELIQYADQPKELKKQTILKKAKFVESKITASGGKIQEVKMDGRTRVWTVKWPNGKTSEVRYGF